MASEASLRSYLTCNGYTCTQALCSCHILAWLPPKLLLSIPHSHEEPHALPSLATRQQAPISLLPALTANLHRLHPLASLALPSPIAAHSGTKHAILKLGFGRNRFVPWKQHCKQHICSVSTKPARHLSRADAKQGWTWRSNSPGRKAGHCCGARWAEPHHSAKWQWAQVAGHWAPEAALWRHCALRSRCGKWQLSRTGISQLFPATPRTHGNHRIHLLLRGESFFLLKSWGKKAFVNLTCAKLARTSVHMQEGLF